MDTDAAEAAKLKGRCGMKVIGVLKGGTVLIEANPAEIRAVTSLFEGLSAELLPASAPRLTQACEPTTPPRRIKLVRSKRSREGGSDKRKKTCAVCGKAFVDDSRTGKRIFCGWECRHQATLAKGRKWREAHTAKSARKPEAKRLPPPAEPVKLSRLDRLAMLRKADEKVTTAGILDAVGQRADAVAKEDAGN